MYFVSDESEQLFLVMVHDMIGKNVHTSFLFDFDRRRQGAHLLD